MVPGPRRPEESPGGSPLLSVWRGRVAAEASRPEQRGQPKEGPCNDMKKEGAAPRGFPPPQPDPRHPEAVLDTAPRVAGIDVHKMSLTCTALVEDDSGRVASETRQYRTYGAELKLLVDWLAGLDLARVVMESTGVFWKTVQRALAEAGVEVWVINARHVKRVPGRKTDVSDSQWLATLARYGLVNPSFVAPPQLEDLRRLTRLYARTRRVASTLRNMLHRMLEESGLRIGGILTDLFGLSGRNLLDGFVEGRDPEQMMAGVKGNARKKIPALLDALGKGLDDGAKPLVVLLRGMLDAVERSLADLEGRILDAVRRDYELPWTLLQTLPGAGPQSVIHIPGIGDPLQRNTHRVGGFFRRKRPSTAPGRTWPSGVVEAGCNQIGARLKRAGMRWTGANAIIALRCCKLSGRFEDFWERRAANAA